MLRPKTGRRMYITKDDVDKMGVTPGCKGCIAAKNNWAPKNHTEACRTRTETAVAAYDKDRFEKALDRYVAAQAKVLEEGDKSSKQEDNGRSKKRNRRKENMGNRKTERNTE